VPIIIDHQNAPHDGLPRRFPMRGEKALKKKHDQNRKDAIKNAHQHLPRDDFPCESVR
jgi:hypothetical protein